MIQIGTNFANDVFDYRKGGGIRHNGDFVNVAFVEKAIAERFGFAVDVIVRTAEAWRRERATEVRAWLTDALSGFEQTARRVVALSGYAGGSPLVVVGRSRLALSVLS
mgnify:CR=1 FL=1